MKKTQYDEIMAELAEIKKILARTEANPRASLTYGSLPENQEYEPIEDEEELDEHFVRSEADLVKIGFIHSSQSKADFTQYDKLVNGVTWSFVTRTSDLDYFIKAGEFVLYCESWVAINEALDEYKLRD